MYDVRGWQLKRIARLGVLAAWSTEVIGIKNHVSGKNATNIDYLSRSLPKTYCQLNFMCRTLGE
ncbi:hypothetical protein CANARDRAFT_175214 [[Candida] arabinofermentans NRRL YB-2248]|uniref:Uncharacterized protein n=1 Tax=[Candida] arabinofermentans NRRL YB-2248 TaxID=983967 RepID=A0A1E4T3G5_9ASCO|nr:hypothetical protein CANARDRAFT_175214 [[Candida] arabinofermentans NRRL YB-2248]